MGVLNKVVAQDAASGALPELYAATMPDVSSGEYYGPDGIGEVRGSPRLVGSSRASKDEAVAARLWDAAVELTGVPFEITRGGM